MTQAHPPVPTAGAPTIAHFAGPLVEATIMVYSTITSQLLPTPAKSHYTFNLRDLSKVFQGMLMADPAKVEVRIRQPPFPVSSGGEPTVPSASSPAPRFSALLPLQHSPALSWPGPGWGQEQAGLQAGLQALCFPIAAAWLAAQTHA